MIVKMWPVRGTHGLKSCVDYVRDDNKVMSITIDANGNEFRTVECALEAEAREAVIDNMDDLENVIAYVSNSEKTEGEGRCYVSGYQCHPNHVVEQFACTREALGVTETKKDDVLCYHMVQSFPKGMDITPELAHQCGLELLEKLGAHQGIVCTHIHPVVDENGELHGEQIHNHIVFNAYKMPDFIDPDHPNQLKYNRCNETYAQMQAWNDEIALDHGLPIIAELDASKIYDWTLGDKNKTNNWSDRMRYDIREARHKAKNWDDFVKRMTKAGYSIREGDTVTFTAPDGKHRARAATLGKEFTKDYLIMFWALRLQQNKAIAEAMQNGTASPFRQVYDANGGKLYAELPLVNGVSTYRLSLAANGRSADTIDSYFTEGGLYNIVDEAGNKVYTATGSEAKALLMELELERERGKDRDDDIKKRIKAIEQARAEALNEYNKNAGPAYGSYSKFFYNDDGTRKNNLELAFVLGSLLIGKYCGVENEYAQTARAIANRKDAREARVNGPDRRLQMMMDSLSVVKQEGFQTAEDLNKAVAEAGKAYNYAKKAFNNTTRRIENLEPLIKAFEDYEDTAELVGMIQSMQDGDEKNKLIADNQTVFEKYNAAKRTMYSFKTTTPERIEETRQRYKRMKAELPELEEKYDTAKANMRTLKRTQYAFQLSHSADYLAGKETEPASMEQEQKREKQTGTTKTTRTKSTERDR